MKSWVEKLNDNTPHVVKRLPVDIAGMKKGEIVLVPSIRLIEAFVRKLPRGESVSIREMRRRLARHYKAEVTCPVYTGYHLRTLAEAAMELRRNGVRIEELPPIWRVLDETTPTWKKLSTDGVALLAAERRREGLTPAEPTSPSPRGRRGRSRSG